MLSGTPGMLFLTLLFSRGRRAALVKMPWPLGMAPVTAWICQLMMRARRSEEGVFCARVRGMGVPRLPPAQLCVFRILWRLRALPQSRRRFGHLRVPWNVALVTSSTAPRLLTRGEWLSHGPRSWSGAPPRFGGCALMISGSNRRAWTLRLLILLQGLGPLLGFKGRRLVRPSPGVPRGGRKPRGVLPRSSLAAVSAFVTWREPGQRG